MPLQRLNPKAFLPPRPVRVRGEAEAGELTNLEYILRFEIEDPFVEADKSPFNVRHTFTTIASVGRGQRPIPLGACVASLTIRSI